jgi:mannose-6-phosphate isomerase-like protein (cupin superfamily)
MISAGAATAALRGRSTCGVKNVAYLESHAVDGVLTCAPSTVVTCMFPQHSHPGEEIIYVLEGVWEYQVEGKGPMKLKAGEILFIPAGVKHGAKNVGSGKGSELATYIVEKGKPLVVLAK